MKQPVFLFPQFEESAVLSPVFFISFYILSLVWICFLEYLNTYLKFFFTKFIMMYIIFRLLYQYYVKRFLLYFCMPTSCSLNHLYVIMLHSYILLCFLLPESFWNKHFDMSVKASRSLGKASVRQWHLAVPLPLSGLFIPERRQLHVHYLTDECGTPFQVCHDTCLDACNFYIWFPHNFQTVGR